MRQDTIENIKTVTDGLSLGTFLATIANILPSIATLFTVVWMAIRICETKTVRSWFKGWRE